MDFSQGATTLPSFSSSLRDHPLLRRLCLHGYEVDLTGLETVLLSDNSKITELDIGITFYGRSTIIGLTSVLQALARRHTLTELALRAVHLGRDEASQLGMVLYSTPSLQTLVLTRTYLGSAGLADLAPGLYGNTSIKVLDMSWGDLDDMDSANLLRDILRRNKTMTALDLSGNGFGETTGAVECIADGLGSNSTLLKIDLAHCALGDVGVATLAQTLGSRNTMLQKLILSCNSITAAGVRVLVETMEQSSHHITDLDIQQNRIGNEGASLLARSLGNNAIPNLTRLSLTICTDDLISALEHNTSLLRLDLRDSKIGDDGLIALVSALEQNKTLLHLDLRYNYAFSERAFLALAESLPEIKVLQRVDLNWCPASAMPLLLVGLRENTSLFRFHATGFGQQVPPTTEDTARTSAGGWMREMERLGYRNRFLSLIRAPKERLPPRGAWPHALARAATHPDVIFGVLRSKPNLVPSEDTAGKEAAEDTDFSTKRKHDDE
jgi:Ran GTPase-activating protein (RanGAP) involved in mRNA processing and transport